VCHVTFTLAHQGVVVGTTGFAPTTFTTKNLATPTCTTTAGVRIVSQTCTYSGGSVWTTIASALTPYKDVVCPLVFVFVPTKCAVHEILALVGVSSSGKSTAVSGTSAHPATQWMGQLVGLAVTAPNAIKQGISTGTAGCPIPAASIPTTVRGNSLTTCSSIASAESTSNKSGWLTILRAMGGLVLSVIMLFGLVAFLRKTLGAQE